MNWKSIRIFSYLLTVTGLALILTLARLPGELDPALDQILPKQILKVERPVVPPPETKAEPVIADSINPPEDLAPQALPADVSANTGFGTGYGGNGPAIAGGGGLGDNEALNSGRNQDRAPQVQTRMPVEYPQDAKAKNLSGYVKFRLLIGVDGTVQDIKILESEPQNIFETAVKNSVRSWRFTPGTVQGKVASLWVMQKVRFDFE